MWISKLGFHLVWIRERVPLEVRWGRIATHDIKQTKTLFLPFFFGETGRVFFLPFLLRWRLAVKGVCAMGVRNGRDDCCDKMVSACWLSFDSWIKSEFFFIFFSYILFRWIYVFGLDFYWIVHIWDEGDFEKITPIYILCCVNGKLKCFVF